MWNNQAAIQWINMHPCRLNGCEKNRDMSETANVKALSQKEMNNYRLTSMEEPGDERMAQIMREVAADARESTRRTAAKVAAGIEAATREARAKVEETINRLRNGAN